MKNLAVFTSGGDSPGMNACVRAVVRTAIFKGIKVYGIYEGYQGMIENKIVELNTKSVAHIIHKGGTILKTSRSDEFRTPQGRKKAFENLKHLDIGGLIAIGGDGTFQGALKFYNEFNIPTIGIPGTIDNDLVGTDFTIGYDSALNTIIESVDKIRDTADSHDRLFFVEVMGKDAGLLALRSGIASGAEAVLIPETKTYIDSLVDKLGIHRRKNKSSGIVIVAEGDDFGGAYKVMEAVKDKYPHFDIRVTILGHIQRGGNPSAMDRVLASRLGYGAVLALHEGKSSCMIGVVNGEYAYTPFESALKHHEMVSSYYIDLLDVLSL